MNRIIGIRHRTKMTVEGEARPTQIVIVDGSRKPKIINLADTTSEIDFCLGQLPKKFREVDKNEDVSKTPSRHIKWRNAKEEDLSKRHESQILTGENNKTLVAEKIAKVFEGLNPGDTVAMILGGSGDMLAYGLAKQAEKIGATVLRIPTFVFKEERGDESKDEDAFLLTKLASEKRHIFYEMRPNDGAMIQVRETLRVRNDAMKARIAVEQQIRQGLNRKVLSSLSIEGTIEAKFDAVKANDDIYNGVLAAERRAERELVKAIEGTEVYMNIFKPVEGAGPKTIGRLLAAIIDIRRFETKEKLKAFCGVHVLDEGKFARRRSGQVSNWHSDARQALYLLASGQFPRRKNSVWGKIFLAYKAKLREKHPETIIGENGKKKYNDGHIHNMAIWRTATKFVEWLYREWWRLEGCESDRPTVPDSLAWADSKLYMELVEAEGYTGQLPPCLNENIDKAA